MRLLVLVTAFVVAGCVPEAAAPDVVVSASPVALRVVPEEALLVPADIPGPGWRVAERSQGAVGTPEWAGWLSSCPGHRETFPTRDLRIDVLSRLYAVWPEGTSKVLQTVELYPSGRDAIADLRVLVDLCADYEFAGRDNPAFRERATVLPSDGLFVRFVRSAELGDSTRYVAVARRGDALVTLEMTGVSEAVARTVATQAAGRLGRV